MTASIQVADSAAPGAPASRTSHLECLRSEGSWSPVQARYPKLWALREAESKHVSGATDRAIQLLALTAVRTRAQFQAHMGAGPGVFAGRERRAGGRGVSADNRPSRLGRDLDVVADGPSRFGSGSCFAR